MSAPITLHLLAVVIWVGGMFFAYMALRPAAGLLEPPVRLTLWSHTFKRFFPWVWVSIITLLVTGFGIIKQSGGMGEVGPHVHIMLLLGIIMMLMFLHVFFAPHKKLALAVESQDWETGAKALNQIRLLISINLLLGLITTVVGSAGQFY
ncbi:MAG: hypothetical protein HN475_03710 [Piscirickettsiaceae bacterium]|jgi:uncharacterized membrane protein|nr:hypothetical protein [Piscirickettsiaceae bacterium]